MTTSRRWDLHSTYSSGDLQPTLSKLASTLGADIARMSTDELDGPVLAEAITGAREEGTDLGEATMTWTPAAAGVEVEVTVPYTGGTSALAYDSSSDTGYGYRTRSHGPGSWDYDYRAQQLVATRAWTTPPPTTEVTEWRDGAVAALREAVARANALIAAHNEGLTLLVDEAVATRRTNLEALESFREAFGEPTER